MAHVLPNLVTRVIAARNLMFYPTISGPSVYIPWTFRSATVGPTISGLLVPVPHNLATRVTPAR